MKKRILDTSILIGLWQQRRGSSAVRVTNSKAKRWAKELIDLYETNAIATPVYLEVIAGVTSRRELDLTRAFLAEFVCLDEGKILEQDWTQAIQLASRVPGVGRPRHLGDCLIRAIADRLRCEVKTHDTGFPLPAPRHKRSR